MTHMCKFQTGLLWSLLLLFSLDLHSCFEAGAITIRIPFTGGTRKCMANTCPSGYQYVDDYACSDGAGWGAGRGYFRDPIPPDQGFVLHTINATMYISCSIETNGLILLEDTLQTTFSVSTNSSCPNCVVGFTFDGIREPDGVVGYKYQQNNSLDIFVPSTSTFCVSYVDLTLSYGPVSYHVATLDPAFGPIGGNTIVYINGKGFYESSELACKFNTTRVPATYISNATISCLSPSVSTGPCNVTVEVSEDGISYTYNKVEFVYTGTTPPHQISMVWVWIAISICVASVLFVAIAGYFYAQRHKTRSDASLIDEKSRLINSDKYKQFGSVQPVDMSEIIIQQRIGRGSCAEVFMGSWRGTTVAIKKAKVFADDDEEFFMELSQEAAIMSELRHPNVLQFLGTASNPPEIVIIMEFMARGSLYRIIHDRTVDLLWPRIKSMALDIARGMNYLHCSDPIIIHRDLKSHNLLVDEHFKVKVCDFGLSTMVKRHLDRFTAMTPVGTPCWTAPEVLRNELYTERADVFSFGVVLWELVTREDPYQGMPTFQIVIAVGQHKMRPLIPPNTPPALAQLMVECWSEDPNARPPFSDIVPRLEKM